MAKAFLIKIPTKNNLPEPNYGLNKSDWLICPPPPLKSYWLKLQCQKTVLVEIPTKNNLPGPNYEAKNLIGWFAPPPSWNPIGWNRNVKKPYWSKSRSKITFPNRTTGQRNLIGWFIPPLKFYWLKPQCQKTLLVEIPTENNLRLPFGQHLCFFDPADIQASKQLFRQFMFARLFSTRKRITQNSYFLFLWVKSY